MRLVERPIQHGPQAKPRRRPWRRFRRDETGATAVEFSLVALPFVSLLFAIVETGYSLWAGQVLDTALFDASRQLYTGTFQSANSKTAPADLPQAFKTEMCKRVSALIDCSQVKIDIQRYDSSKSPAPPITPDGQFDSANFGKYYNPGPSEIVVVRAAVEVPIYVSLMNPNMANLKNGKRLVMATAVFKTEPFPPSS